MSHEQNTLVSRQQMLISMIYGLQKANPKYSEGFSRGLRIYQNNLQATASRALSVSYPVVDKLLGGEAMQALARMLLQSTPPATGDWADWGEDFKELLLSTPLVEENPFLFDIARLEWLLHRVSRASARPLVKDSLSLLADRPVEQLRFQLAGSVHVLASDYPVDILWKAHQEVDTLFQLDAYSLARELEEQQGPCHLIIFQQDKAPRMQRISEDDYAWFCDVLEGHNLSDLLDRHPQFDFSRWLSTALEHQWIEQLVDLN